MKSLERNIEELSFLIGSWRIREENTATAWWSEGIDVISCVIDATYIELRSNAKSSDGKESSARRFIHFNSKNQNFEMISFKGNSDQVLFDFLEWNPNEKTMIIRDSKKMTSEEYSERYRKIRFEEDFKSYRCDGVIKHSTSKNPRKWEFVQKGIKLG